MREGFLCSPAREQQRIRPTAVSVVGRFCCREDFTLVPSSVNRLRVGEIHKGMWKTRELDNAR